MSGSVAPATMLGSGQWLWRFGRESSERAEIENFDFQKKGKCCFESAGFENLEYLRFFILNNLW